MILLKNIKEALTLKSAADKDGRNLLPKDKDIQKNISILCDDGVIKSIGPIETIKNIKKGTVEIDCSNLCVTPEIVDSHTHFVFGGNRAF